MNYGYIFRTLGRIYILMAIFLILPLFVAGIYQEEQTYYAFIIPILLLFGIGICLVEWIKPKKKNIYAKEGLMIVSLAWLSISVFGALPYVISGEIPNFFDALFETASGFTTTGATVINDVESLSHSILFWRGFTHWIGGMGVIVFFLAFFPKLDNSRSMYILRVESPGPQVGKIVSKMKYSTRIIYQIYIALTIVLWLFLWLGGMPLFDSIVHTFATAGTGGFSIKNSSIGAYQNLYFEIVIATFMFIFSVNFNVYYLMLIGQIKKGLKSEELLWYVGFVAASIVLIAFNIYRLTANMGEALRLSYFQVTSIVSTTGFSTTDYTTWPAFSQGILLILLFMGGMGGSSSGGIKASRFILFGKLIRREIDAIIHPNEIKAIRFEGRAVENRLLKEVGVFLMAYFMILTIGTLLVSYETNDLFTSITVMTTSLSNNGLAFGQLGPTENFSIFSNGLKAFLSLVMIAGRLEIFPILVLLSPRLWKKL